MYFSVLNSFLEKKNIFIDYWQVFWRKSIFGQNGILSKSQNIFFRNNFFYLILIWGLRKSTLKIDPANICEDHFLVKNANTVNACQRTTGLDTESLSI